MYLQETTAAADAAAAVTVAAAENISVQQLQHVNQQLQQQLDTQAEALEALTKSRDEAQLELSDTQQQLDKQWQAAQNANSAVAALERRLIDLQAEVSLLVLSDNPPSPVYSCRPHWTSTWCAQSENLLVCMCWLSSHESGINLAAGSSPRI